MPVSAGFRQRLAGRSRWGMLGWVGAGSPGTEVLGASEVANDGRRDADLLFVQQLPGRLNGLADGDRVE